MSDHFDNKLKRKLAGDADETGRGVSSVRRIELITGTGRRRRWSRDDKARIVEESLKPGATVSEVARRNGLSPSMSFFKQKVAKLRHRANGTALHFVKTVGSGAGRRWRRSINLPSAGRNRMNVCRRRPISDSARASE